MVTTATPSDTSVIEATYEAWHDKLFPNQPTKTWATYHHEFGQWEWSIEADNAPDPLAVVWGRGAAKSTRAERLVISVGARQVRRYVLYVSGTQLQANRHLGSIGHDLEANPQVQEYYPDLATRAVNKYSHSRGWNTTRLVTQAGLVIEAMGLDTAARGVRFEEQRPDLIVLDDIDSADDSLDVITSKEYTLTHDILPALARNGTVLVAQNLIHRNGIVAKIVDGRADYLARAKVIGPVPLIYDFEYERLTERAQENGVKALITGGTPSWPQWMTLDSCQHTINLIGIDAFLAECQHDIGYTGSPRFNRQAIDGHKLRVRPPLPRAALPPALRNIEHLRVWELPQPGATYVAYTDPAEGKGRDYCWSGIGEVISGGGTDHPKVQHVATLRDNVLETSQHADLFYKVLEEYGFPMWAYERAKGTGVALVQGRVNYPRQVWFADREPTDKERREGIQPTKRQGFQMTHASKATLIGKYATAYETYAFNSPDEQLHDEHGVFMVLDGNKLGAKPPEHDDGVIGAAGIYLTAQQPGAQSVRGGAPLRAVQMRGGF